MTTGVAQAWPTWQKAMDVANQLARADGVRRRVRRCDPAWCGYSTGWHVTRENEEP